MDFRAIANHWFALQVRTCFEQACARILKNKGYEEFVPVLRSSRAGQDHRPLFPGYVFCRFSGDIKGPIVTTPGVIRIVGYGGVPAPISAEEIASIRTIVESGRSVWPVPYLCAGERVRITRGPFNGVVGALLKVKNSQRLVVSIDILQRSAAVEIGIESVTPMRAGVA